MTEYEHLGSPIENDEPPDSPSEISSLSSQICRDSKADQATSKGDAGGNRYSPVALAVVSNVESAVKAAAGINRADLTELRNSKSAPKGVHEVLSVILSVAHHSPWQRDWDATRREASDPGCRLVSKLMAFHPTSLTQFDLLAVEAPRPEEKIRLGAVVKMMKWLDYMLAAHRREATLNADLKQPLGMKLTKSGTVHYVTQGGQFDLAGIAKGDVVVGIGSIRVATSDDFAATLKLYKAAGGAVSIIFKEGNPKKDSASDSAKKPKALPKVTATSANEPISSAPRECVSGFQKGNSFQKKGNSTPSPAGTPAGTPIKNL